MIDREECIRRNALDYLDDLIIGAKDSDLGADDKAQIAMFLIENLIPIDTEEDDVDITALLTKESAP